MKVFIFSFTKQASLLSLLLLEQFYHKDYPCICYTMEKYAVMPNLTAFPKSLKETVSDCFSKDHVLIFIGACGIAVRSIAPFVKDKTTDPCVLVIDEKGNYVISLLSGHLGGGNEFADMTANLIGATPIISTATDLNHRFSVDNFAKKNGLILSDMKVAKKISAALLDGENVGGFGVVPEGEIPEGIVYPDRNEALAESLLPTSFHTSFCISPWKQDVASEETLYLIPKQVVLGIGCKKNTPPFALSAFVGEILAEHNIFKESIKAIASIDLKKEEEALLSLAKELDVPFVTYTAEELLKVPGDFTASNFVKKITGVDNVCERSTLNYSHADKLYLKKTAKNGMTIAISLLPISVHF